MSRLVKTLMLIATILAGLIAALMMHGCATVTPVLKSCEPSTAQEMRLVQAASIPDRALALAAIDGLGFALCVLQKGADEAIGALQAKSGETVLALTASSYSPVVANLKAWRAVHP